MPILRKFLRVRMIVDIMSYVRIQEAAEIGRSNSGCELGSPMALASSQIKLTDIAVKRR